MAVTVRYFAGARAAVGLDTESREAGTLDELVGQIVGEHGERLHDLGNRHSIGSAHDDLRGRVAELP